MRSKVRFSIVAVLLGMGFWQLGEGVYIPAKALFAQQLLQNAWERSVANNGHARPWPWADTWPVARLTANGGAIDLIVLAGGSGRTLAFGPGHMLGSAQPGATGNAVIAGHRDTHFRFLKSLQVGDIIDIETPMGARHRFEVIDADVADARNSALRIDSDVPMLSLVTCYPFDAVEPGGPLRYVVTARIHNDT